MAIVRVVAELEGEAVAALQRIKDRLNDDNIDDIISAAIVVYDMHQDAMVHRLEQLRAEGAGDIVARETKAGKVVELLVRYGEFDEGEIDIADVLAICLGWEGTGESSDVRLEWWLESSTCEIADWIILWWDKFVETRGGDNAVGVKGAKTV